MCAEAGYFGVGRDFDVLGGLSAMKRINLEVDAEIFRSKADLFWQKVSVGRADECWPWNGPRWKGGYGRFQIGLGYPKSKTMVASRVAWLLTNGVFHEGMQVCHKCDNPICVNPNHLFIGTQTDNLRDCAAKKRSVNSAKTHCPRGHEYSPENTFYQANGTQRACRLCLKIRSEERNRRQRALASHKTVCTKSATSMSCTGECG